MKAVLFDFGGTLDSDGLTWGDRFFPLYSEAGLAVTREVFNKAFYKSDDNLPTRFNLDGKGLPETLDLQVGCVLEDVAPDRLDLKTQIAGRFLNQCREAFDRNRPVLDRLKKKYKLGIVSNFYGNLKDILADERLNGFFDVVADSTTVGHLKPSAEIFLYAANALGAKPGECVMVGDSIPRDMKGAEDLGMPHALITQNGKICCPAGWKISTLAELERRLS
jgi:putative hydrolase of the HAD superfamily